MREVREGRVPAGGVPVRFLEAGSGPPVVLLHGADVGSADLTWRPTVPVLAERFHVIAPDLPGHGHTPPLPRPPATEAYVRWLGAFVDVLRLDRFSLVGLSLGGAVSLGFALQNPDRVSRLVLVASYGLMRRVPLHALAHRLVRIPPLPSLLARLRSSAHPFPLRIALRWIVGDPRTLTPDLLQEVAGAVRARGRKNLFYAWLATELNRKTVRTCYLDRLPELRAPTLLLHGDRDRLVPVGWAREAARRIPHARLVVFPGCGHWVPRERPEEFHRELLAFLADQNGAGRRESSLRA
ncbi:MAG: alpha/beta fold hydrolase [Armatimonadota bacterium]|nr:alpha/beta fold hydrolase [Armatimonadota bacterium]MDR7444395.1 alpha/beta fold hydrolase [Armatimonadota bacterium]MDR7570751.1 alpha/beta fold hydrolase [Armatimonadota bacterium]MDR7614881.1 alpha/beta fold hydrolase [Armatimonadota bacterium]